MLKCGNAEIRKYGNAEIRTCENAEIRKYENTVMLTCENIGIQKYEYGNTSIESFPNTRDRHLDIAEVRKNVQEIVLA